MQDDEFYSDEGDNRSNDESVDNDDDDDDDDDTNGDDYNDAVTGMVGTRVDGLLLTKLLGLGTFGAVYEGETTAGGTSAVCVCSVAVCLKLSPAQRARPSTPSSVCSRRDCGQSTWTCNARRSSSTSGWASTRTWRTWCV